MVFTREMELGRVLKNILAPPSVHDVHSNRLLSSKNGARSYFNKHSFLLPSLRYVREMNLVRAFKNMFSALPTCGPLDKWS